MLGFELGEKEGLGGKGGDGLPPSRSVRGRGEPKA